MGAGGEGWPHASARRRWWARGFQPARAHAAAAAAPRRHNLASAFRSHVVNSKETDATSLAPVRQLGDASLVYLRSGNVYLLAITKHNTNAMMAMQFLSRVRGAGPCGTCAVGAAVWWVLVGTWWVLAARHSVQRPAGMRRSPQAGLHRR